MAARDHRREERLGAVATALRVERAEGELLARTGSPGIAGALDVAGGLAVSKGPRSVLSAAFGLGLSGPVSTRELDRVEAHLGALGGEVRVELCPQADPALAAELARRRYRVTRFLLVLSRPVERRADAAAGRRPSEAGVEVRAIRPDEAHAWVDAFAVAHHGEPPATDEAVDDLLAVTRAEGSICFAALDLGVPVAVALLSVHRRLALLSGAGVVPRWRGRGLQLALVRGRLAAAARLGCDLAAAATEPGGASQLTLEKAGFRVAYPKVVLVREGWAGADASWQI